MAIPTTNEMASVDRSSAPERSWYTSASSVPPSAATVPTTPEETPPASRVRLFTSKLGLRKLPSATVKISSPVTMER